MKGLIRFSYLFLLSIAIFSIGYLPSYFTKKPEPTLNVFVWGDFFPEETFRRFERETGIKINPSYYSSNEELILKLEKTEGKGYDLIFPSDYAVSALSQKNLLQPLRPTSAIKKIDPSLLDLPFDPKNTYSLPYLWEVYGLTEEGPLSMLFDGSHKVVMVQDPIEAFSFATHYLKGKGSPLEILKQQKQFVEAYTDHRAHYLISSSDPPLAILRSSFFFKHPDTLSQFHPPKNSTFVTIENVALSSACEHVKEAYQFIEFIYQKEIMALQVDQVPLFPSRKDCLDFTTIPLSPRYYELLETLSINDLLFFTVPSEHVRPLWVEVQS